MTEWVELVCPKCEDAGQSTIDDITDNPRCDEHQEPLIPRAQFTEARDRFNELVGKQLIGTFLRKILTEARDENRPVIGPLWALEMIGRRAEQIGVRNYDIREVTTWQ